MLKQNLHTHSTYCDGKDMIEEMVLAAIDKGFTTLGFSGHSHLKFDEVSAMSKEGTSRYIKDVLEMKEKYKDKNIIF